MPAIQRGRPSGTELHPLPLARTGPLPQRGSGAARARALPTENTLQRGSHFVFLTRTHVWIWADHLLPAQTKLNFVFTEKNLSQCYVPALGISELWILPRGLSSRSQSVRFAGRSCPCPLLCTRCVTRQALVLLPLLPLQGQNWPCRVSCGLLRTFLLKT